MGKRKGKIKFTLQIVTIVSNIAIIMSFAVQCESLVSQQISMESQCKNYNDSHIFQLVERFHGPEMAECRQRCWLLKTDIEHGSNKRDEIKELFIKQIMDEWGTSIEYEALQQEEIFKDYAQFTKLIRFFDILSRYDLSKEAADAIQFYYYWWRPFFVDMINCYKEAEESVLTDCRLRPSWIDLIDRMDDKLRKAM